MFFDRIGQKRQKIQKNAQFLKSSPIGTNAFRIGSYKIFQKGAEKLKVQTRVKNPPSSRSNPGRLYSQPAS